MQKFDARQSIYRGTLDQLSTANNPELDNLLKATNDDLTALLRVSANSPADLIVNVGAGELLNTESNRRRAIPHIGSAYVQFSSGTVTFPAASGGNIVCAPGNSTVLNVASGNYAAVLIYLDGAGDLNAIAGADAATETAAITNLPPAPDETLAAGFVVVRNVAGVIQSLTQNSIRQFGTGTGGGGSGSGNELLESLKNQFIDSYFQLLTPNIFRVDKGTKVDVSSTGAYSLIDRSFNFAASSVQTFVSTDMLDPQEFLANANSLEEVEVSVYWRLANIDTSAVYQVSRNGGLEWQTLSMERIGTTDMYRGYHRFADEVANQTLYSPAVSGDLNASNELSQSFVVPAGEKKLIKGATLTLTKTGTPAGNIFVSICADNAGSPGTVLSESSAITANSLTTGSNTVSIPDVYLAAGTYHIKVRTDAAYKASYVNGVTELNLSGSTVAGLDLDLRLRISSSNTAGIKKLEGYGIFYDKALSANAADGSINTETFEFSGSLNTFEFTLTKFVPHPDLLKVYDINTGQVYVHGTFGLDGQKVIFESGQFLQPGQTIKLKFVQIEGSAFDTSDANALSIASINTNLDAVGSQIEELDFVNIPKIVAPNTAIVNRAPIIDLSQDLNARMGINRIMTQQVARIQNEFGPNGESVFRAVNDRLDQVRYVGSGWNSAVNSFGQVTQTANVGDYVEIAFYGTGLNLLTLAGTVGTDYRISIDGGAEGANLFPVGSTILGGRNYTPNQLINIASNLSLGVHTVKVRLAAFAAYNLNVYGFEILNETQNIRVRPGTQLVKGKARTLGSEDQESFNSGFELGTLGTRGGRVVIYQKADGSIGKAVTPTDATQLNLASANHASEEVVRVYSPREFGAGRADDFSTLSSSGSNRAFTLDDGTTTLVAANGRAVTATVEGVGVASGTTNFLTFTFVGTALDIVLADDGVNTRNFGAIQIDGASSIGTIFNTSTASVRVTRIVSGLPYGTHTVKFTNGAAGLDSPLIASFIVYQPKTPSIPTGAKAIAAYNVMADFVANSTAGVDRLATGILRKAVVREAQYIGAWDTYTVDATLLGGVNFGKSSGLSGNEDLIRVFWGTGLDFRCIVSTDRPSNVDVFLNGILVSTANFNINGTGTPTYGSITVSTYGGTTFTPGTGKVSFNGTTAQGAGFRISGLSLGLWSFRLDNNTSGAGNWTIAAFDIITPIHSPKSNLFTTAQNTLSIGSQGIEDLRKIKALEQITDQKAISQAVGIASSPTTSSTVFVPVPDLSVTHNVKTGRIKVSYTAQVQSTGINQNTDLSIYVNGAQQSPPKGYQAFANNANGLVTDSFFIILPVGVNKIDVYWRVTGGTSTANGVQRNLTVEDV